MGALEFVPAKDDYLDQSSAIEISSLVEIASEVLSSKAELNTNLNADTKEALANIIKVSTSAGGQRAKAVIAYNDKTGEVRSGQVDAPADFSHWLLKLDGVTNSALGDPQHYGKIEYSYYKMALNAGLEMTECRLLEENGRAHFMTKRFDRIGGNEKVHMQTLCGLAHYDYKMLHAYSYEQAFQVMRQLRLPYGQAEQMFRRMVFNVIARNQDDHTKNISFLMDKTKVSLTEEKGVKLFPIFSNGQMLSTGLNIMFGKRSTGKTYTLDAIAKKFGDRAKYIRQFELLNTGKNDSDQFESDQKVRQERYAEDFFKEFSDVVTDMLETSSEAEDEIKLQKYLEAVMASATQNDVNDVFSKSALFNESEFNEQNYDELKKLISATETLLETQQYKEVISKHISPKSLKALLKELIEIYRNHKLNGKYQKEVNNMQKLVKESLQLKSAAPRIPNVDLYQYFLNRKKREVFAQIAIAIKKNRTISNEKAGQFTISVSARPFANATDLKTVMLRQISLASAFDKYNNPVQYLDALKNAGVESDRIYKLFAAIDYKILNSSGLPVSGGERSEFNFLQKIKDAILSDILLIDEPESSFDNIFLKNEVNKFVKEMAENMPVVITTHNNTIGGSIKPDYILYTEKKIVGGTPEFFTYSGYPGSKELRDVNGNGIKNYEITLDRLEAGEEAYTERKGIYETLKN